MEDALDDGASMASPADEASTEQKLLDRMARFRRSPLNWLYEIALFVSGSEWRGYDKIIGQNVFYKGYTNKITTAVMASPLLEQKLVQLTEARLVVEEDEHLLDREAANFALLKDRRRLEIHESLVQIVAGMISQMICKMESKPYIRTAFYGCTQLLTRAYSGAHVSLPEVKRLREIAAVAAKNKHSIIFLPRHSSHIDYVSLQLICYRLGLTLPVVVAGDNLNFPVVGNFLQSCGAMWIRRSFDGDPLYTALVQAYLDTLLQGGYNLECFIEGTRSRTGKLLQPKFGILSFLLDSVLSGRTDDALICPVSLQYDKVIEVDSYVTELLGKPKQKENLTDFLSSSSLLSYNFGRIDCRFHEPWSLKEFISEQNARQPEQNSPDLADSMPSSAARIRLLRTLGYRVLADINKVSVIMPSALVGTILLTLRGRGVGMSELVRRVDWLCMRIEANHGQVADFHKMPTRFVVERALEVLGPGLVSRTEDLAETTLRVEDAFQLSFYRNMTIHLFISEALISAALYTKVKQGGGNANQRICEQELTEKVTFLSQLFRGEFIFPAGQGLTRNLDDAMQGLVKEQVLEISEEEGGERQVGLTSVERLKGRDTFDFYCFLIWPFVDAAWLGAVSLFCLVPPFGTTEAWIGMKQAQDTAQLFGKTLYYQGDLSYLEAANKEALKNSYSRFQEEGIIMVAKAKDPKTGPTVRISPDWTPRRDPETGELKTEGRLWDFAERISQHRREGKNRRDNATVSTRVLALVTTLGKKLFESDAPQIEGVTSVSSPQRRRSRL